MGAETSELNKLLDKYFNDTDFTIGDTFIALFNGDPTGAGTEVSGGSYARQQVDENGGSSPTWTTASGGVVDNNANVDFNDMPADTIDFVAIFDASSAGNMLWSGALDNSRTTQSGDTVRFETGDLNVQIT